MANERALIGIDLGNVVGPQGPKGDKGDTGSQGVQGPKGETGAKGDTGATFTPAVSANGELSWSNDKGLANPSAVNIKGPKGDKGDKGDTGAAGVDGAKGEKGDTGEQGPRGLQGVQGPKGEKGDPFSVAKIYASVAAMNAGYAADGVPVGGFVVIDTGNVEDEDNAKLYVKGEQTYTYVTDLSGATGMQGPQGIQGVQGIQGPKGDKGDKGETGANGDTPTFEIREDGHLYALFPNH